jgi:hypothetical protein
VVYVWKPRDASEQFLDGGRHYRLHLPPSDEPTLFWSVVVYDANRSAPPGECPSLCTYTATPNADGSVDVYFGPTPPPGRERNWIRTASGKAWFPRIRFYSPLQPLTEHVWKPGDIVETGAEFGTAA